jgi:hypothetical protein
MSQLKDWQSGTSNDPYVVGSSGSLTLNQGTANGVAYLNGSKVVTSGSALTFDGTNLGIGGAASSFTNYSTVSVNNTNGGIVNLLVNGTETARMQAYSGVFNIAAKGASTVTAFEVNGSEQMRLTSTGLGIGTSSPGRNLTINATIPILQFTNPTSGTTANDGLLIYQNGLNAYFSNQEAGAAIFETNNAERMRLDSSGNLGLGVTPSAWSAQRAIELPNGVSLASYTSGVNIGQMFTNAYFNGTDYIFKNSDYAEQYAQRQGKHIWYVSSASGTAGNAITFTQALTLDASGNLLVGTTSANGLGGTTLNSGYALWNSSSNNTTRLFFWYNGSAVGTVTTTGTSTSYNTSSDQRLKENIQNADSASSLIDALQVRKFDWKEDGSHQRYGFVAQELVQVAPEAVHQPEDTEQMMAVDYSKLVPMLVKEIQSLRKRLADAGIA